jgi:osmotically-inducible protein OsmY
MAIRSLKKLMLLSIATPLFDATRIHVELHGNKVLPSGKVRSWIEKKNAEKVAWSSPGINRVEIKLK